MKKAKKIIVFIILLSTVICSGCGIADVECYCCGKYINSDSAKDVCDEYFCKDCYSHIPQCAGCNKRYIYDLSLYKYSGYCDSCMEELFEQCPNCGEYVKKGNLYYVDEYDDVMCADCIIKSIY